MGFLIVTIVGSVMGWLAAIIVERDDRVGAIACAIAGVTGAFAAALLSGDVPLAAGVSAMQCLWAVLGAALVIICVNAIAARKAMRVAGNV